MTPMLLDTVVIIVILLSILIALFRGFVKEMLTIVNLLGAGLAARYLSPLILPGIRDWLLNGHDPKDKAHYIFGVVPPDVAATFLSYTAIFFGVFLILSLAGMAISGGVKAMGLGPVDKFLGILFGALRGFLLVFLVYAPFAFAMSPQKFPDWVKDSLTFTVMDKSYRTADAYMKDGKLPESGEPADPDSISSRLENMAKKAAGGAEKAGDAIEEKVSDQVEKISEERELLNDEKN